MLVRFNVTQDDILNSIRGCQTHCMIAEVVRRAVRPEVSISVTRGTLYLGYGPDLNKYHFFSDEIAAKIVDFDAGCAVPDFSFSVDIDVIYLKATVIGYHLMMNDSEQNNPEENHPLKIDLPETITTEGLPDGPPPIAKPERELVPA